MDEEKIILKSEDNHQVFWILFFTQLTLIFLASILESLFNLQITIQWFIPIILNVLVLGSINAVYGWGTGR